MISSLRNHPYNNSKSRPLSSTVPEPVISSPIVFNSLPIAEASSKPTGPTTSGDILNVLNRKDTLELMNDESPVKNATTVTQTSNHNKNVNLNSKTDKHVKTDELKQKRNSSSNAILAHLRSLSPNFKSIFVRPRNCKPIGKNAF